MADPTNGFILGRDFNFWRKFIDEDGTPDTEAILAKGYAEEQLPDIIDQMEQGGLIGSIKLLDSDSVGDSSENA